MAFSIGKMVSGVSFGLALGIAAIVSPGVEAAPFGSVLAYRDVAAAPIVDVQVRRPVRRPVRPVRRSRGNNAGLAAGLIGAAILGGAIIANSQPRRRAPQYYYDDYGNPVEYYGAPYAPQTYYQQPVQPYYQPAPVYRQQRHNTHSPSSPMYNGPVGQPSRPRVYQPAQTYAPRSGYRSNEPVILNQEGRRVYRDGNGWREENGGPRHPTSGN